jgi:hypothetical protein
MIIYEIICGSALSPQALSSFPGRAARPNGRERTAGKIERVLKRVPVPSGLPAAPLKPKKGIY